jgi:hypothetical protein
VIVQHINSATNPAEPEAESLEETPEAGLGLETGGTASVALLIRYTDSSSQ